jgi:hypothetical protein
MTKLSHVEIRHHFDGKVPLAAYFGDKRVVYEIPYKALDDSFPNLTTVSIPSVRSRRSAKAHKQHPRRG